MDSRKVAQDQAVILGSAATRRCQVDTGKETAKQKNHRRFFKCCERKDSLSAGAFIEASKETPLAVCGYHQIGQPFLHVLLIQIS